MNSRKLVLWALGFCCTVHAQTPVDLHPSHPRLPGTAQAGRFHLAGNGTTPASRWAANLGQGVARFVAHEHGMTNGSLVQYRTPEHSCAFERHPSCP